MPLCDTVAPRWCKGAQAIPFVGQILCNAHGMAVKQAKPKHRVMKLTRPELQQQRYMLQQQLRL